MDVADFSQVRDQMTRIFCSLSEHLINRAWFLRRPFISIVLKVMMKSAKILSNNMVTIKQCSFGGRC
jgi:hypothetical protein